VRTKLIAVTFSHELGRFDDAELAAFLRDRDVAAFREHVVEVDGEPFLLCVVSWHEAVAHAPTAVAVTPASGDRAVTIAGPRPDAPAQPLPEILQGMSPDQRTLFEIVRRWRSQKAHAEGVPPYVLLTNRQLVDLVRARPNTRTGLTALDGFGQRKVERYGPELLALLWPDVPPREPAAAVATAAAPVAEAPA